MAREMSRKSILYEQMIRQRAPRRGIVCNKKALSRV